MIDETKPVQEEKNQLPEAPASATVKIKSKDGFEWLFTIRDEKASQLMFKMKAMEKNWLEGGFTPLAQNSFGKKPATPVEYVEGRMCPNDNARLVKATKKDGTKFIRCENNKFINGQQTGCKFVEWNNQPRQEYPERQVEDY